MIVAVATAAFGVHVSSIPGFIGVALGFGVLTAGFGLLIAAFGKTPEAARGIAESDPYLTLGIFAGVEVFETKKVFPS